MREIKFRVWGPNSKHMWTWEELLVHSIPINWLSNDPNFGSERVIMQFTGLHDKNGVEIYEGDVVESQNFSASEVLFEDGVFLALDTPLNQDWGGCPGNEWEVIGNIYENPELINV